MFHASSVCFSLSLLVLLTASSASAFDVHDVRPVAVLELMDEDELEYEAARACAGIVIARKTPDLRDPDEYRIAHQYLETIGLVLRKKNNGKSSALHTETLKASLGDNIKACFDPFSRYSQIKHEQEMQKLQRYEEDMNRQIERARRPPPVSVPSTEAQINAEYKTARRQDTVKAYQDFLYHHKAHEKHYAEALARLDELLHPGGAKYTGSSQR